MKCAICERKFLKGFTLILVEHKVGEADTTSTYPLCPADAPAMADVFRSEVYSRVGK